MNTKISALSLTIMLATLFASGGQAGLAAQSNPTVVKYSSCAKFNAKYPKGVSKNDAAAEKSFWDNYYAPTISSSIYKTNAGLDKSRTGSLCVKKRPPLGWKVFNTGGGKLHIEKVSSPKFNSCSYVNIKVDVTSPEPNNRSWYLKFIDWSNDYYYGIAFLDQDMMETKGKSYIGKAAKLCSYSYSNDYYKAIKPGVALRPELWVTEVMGNLPYLLDPYQSF